MAVETTPTVYYALMLNTFPFTFGDEQTIGFYTSKSTVIQVEKFARTVFEQQVRGGMDMSIVIHKDILIRTSYGFRTGPTSQGCIRTIYEILSPEEIKRLIRFIPHLIGNNLITPPVESSSIDSPECLIDGNCHSVTLDFQPFDGSHRLYVGSYQHHSVAELVLKYIQNAHQVVKVGSGFNIDMQTYPGKFVVYKSGKRYMKIGENVLEVQAAVPIGGFIKITNAIFKAFNKWDLH